MYLGKCHKIQYGRHFHGNERRRKNYFISPSYFTLIIINRQWNELVEKMRKTIFWPAPVKNHCIRNEWWVKCPILHPPLIITASGMHGEPCDQYWPRCGHSWVCPQPQTSLPQCPPLSPPQRSSHAQTSEWCQGDWYYNTNNTLRPGRDPKGTETTTQTTRSDLRVIPRGLILQYKQHAQTSEWSQGDWYYNTNNTLRPRSDPKGTDTTIQTTRSDLGVIQGDWYYNTNNTLRPGRDPKGTETTTQTTRSDLRVIPRGLILQYKQHAQTSEWSQGDWYYNTNNTLRPRSDPRGLRLQHKQHAQTSEWSQGDWYYNTNNTLRPGRDPKGTDTTTQTTHHIRNNLHNDISGSNSLRVCFIKE